MATIKKFKWALILALIILTGILYFVNRMHSDINTILAFANSYEKFDDSINDLSQSIVGLDLTDVHKINSLEKKADESFFELNTLASKRISSFIKNDSEFMTLEREITDLSKKELETIKKYRNLVQNENANFYELTQILIDLRNKRTNAYSRFEHLVQRTK